jgi:O-antigen ligase
MERLAFNVGLPPTAAPDAARPRRTAPAVAAAPSALDGHDAIAFRWLLAFTVVLFIRPQDQLPFLRPLHLADITATCALIALMAGRLGRGAPISRMTPELRWVLALGAVMLATAPFSVWPGGAVGIFTDLFSKVIVVFALMINTITSRARLERFVSIVVLGTSYIAARSVVDYLRGVNLVEGSRATGAVGGLFGNPNDMALNMVAFLPLAIVMALGRGRPVVRALILAGTPAIAAAIIFSKSRGGVVGLVAMLLVLLYQLRRVRPGFAALVVAASLAAVPMLPESFTERMSSIFNPDEDPTGSREARKRLLREGLQGFVENPVLGLGAGQFQNYNPQGRQERWRETHNAVLQVAAELGVFGLIVFILVVWSGFAAVRSAALAVRGPPGRKRAHEPDAGRRAREPMELYSAAMAASLTGWFMAALFASVAYYWTFYIVLGLATAVRDVARSELDAAVAQAERDEYGAEAA